MRANLNICIFALSLRAVEQLVNSVIIYLRIGVVIIRCQLQNSFFVD